MRRREVQALGLLAGEALAAGGALIQQTHEGIAERVFAHTPTPAPVRLMHDGITKAVYGGLRHGVRGAARAGGELAARRAQPDGGSLLAHPRGSLAVAALNGLYGSQIAERIPELSLEMEVRRHHQSVALDTESVRAAFGDATSRIVVFVHGLCESDLAWRLVAGQPERRDRRTYGQRLQDELSYTPVYLRYNTGLRISENGRRLARLLERLTRVWPVGVEELVLVGHSMGGLVARGACHYGERHGMAFAGAIRHVFCLGAPRFGADLERGAVALGWALRRLPETRPLARALGARSEGIQDLRFGSGAEEDWRDRDPDEFLRDRWHEVPFLPDAHYYFIGSKLTPAPLGRLMGDLLVRVPRGSARGSGRGRRIPFEVHPGHELAGVNHFGLLNHPAVYAQLQAWIAPGRRPLAELPAGRPIALLTA